MSSELEHASSGDADGDEREDTGSTASREPADAAMTPPKLKFDRIGDKADRERVFAALFEVAAERQSLGRYVVLGTLGQGGMGVVLEAFDRTLDRRVALKVLHQRLEDKYTTRLLREAQALAKLSHPNVVQVYESGVADGQMFIAMELVRGKSLRTWLEATPRAGWRECVQVFMQAGAGLAAAHAQGLVHRDFKPSNAVIDEDGRVRVLDFGLARGAEDKEEPTTGDAPAPDSAALDTPLTQTGAVMGTPSYMSPEQSMGREADGRSDQFSFCVSLYEAVYGKRPFRGDSMAELMDSLAEGEVRPAPKGTKVPASLRQVLLRGLAVEPENRWPSMHELLAQLRKQVAPRSWRWAMAGAGLVVGLGLVGAGLAYQADMGQRCVGASAQLAGIWDDARRQEVKAAIVGTGLAYAPSTWERVEQRLGDYASAWVDKHTEVCTAASIRKEQTAEQMGLRMSCLRKRRTQLSAAVDLLADADAEVVKNAVKLTAGLPLLDRCDDLTWLAEQQQRVPPPEDPQVVEQVEALRERMAEIGAQMNTGKYAVAFERADVVVEQAKELGYMPLVAEATIQQGLLHAKNGRYAEAEEDIRRAYRLAVEHGHDEAELWAARTLIYVVGVRLERYDEGLQWADAATPLAVRSGNARDMAENANALGGVAEKQGNFAQARAHYQRAMELNEEALGPDHPEVASNLVGLANVMSAGGNPDEGAALLRRVLRINETTWGPDHPRTAGSMSDLGAALVSLGQLEEAEVLLRRALRLNEEVLGPDHPRVALSANNLGVVVYDLGRYEEAEALYRRALRIHEAAMGPEHPLVLKGMANLGSVLVAIGRVEEGVELLRKALQRSEDVQGADHLNVGLAAINMGVVLEGQGKFEEAEARFRQALRIWEANPEANRQDMAVILKYLADALVPQDKLEEAEGHYQRALQLTEQSEAANPQNLVMILTGLAAISSRLGNLETARAQAERAMTICEGKKAGAIDPLLLATARFALARALWSDETHRARARDLAKQALEAFVEGGARSEGELAEAERWLAEHRVE